MRCTAVIREDCHPLETLELSGRSRVIRTPDPRLPKTGSTRKDESNRTQTYNVNAARTQGRASVALQLRYTL